MDGIDGEALLEVVEADGVVEGLKLQTLIFVHHRDHHSWNGPGGWWIGDGGLVMVDW